MQSVKYLFVLVLLVLAAGAAKATHNRAGYITYRHVGGLEYEITVVTYTKLSAPADRPYLPVIWGDGTPNDSLQRDDVLDNIDLDLRRNIYRETHIYPGPGTYNICVSDPNRNSGVLNISGSVSVYFGISTRLMIGPTAANNSVEITTPPIQDGCINQPWIFNPGAYDPDGDSLSYELTNCLVQNCQPMSDEIYSFPDQIAAGPDNNLTINPDDGTIVWDSPQTAGEYNLAYIIREWQDGSPVGYVLVDMQITIKQCNNQPPVLAAIPDTCVEAGTQLNVALNASDPDDNNIVLEGGGGPFVQDVSPATIEQPSTDNPVTGNFRWNTECAHVRSEPYHVSIIASDDAPSVSSADYETFNVTVVAPPVTGVGVTPQGSDFIIDWNPTICSNASCYKIYRRAGPYNFIPDNCETGVPAYTGYELIATLNDSTISYTDDSGLDFGRPYCYLIVTCFPDGAESYASQEVCASLDRVIPIITKVSIGETDTDNGIDTLRWEKPTQIDTLNQVLPPYKYRIYRGSGFNTADELVYETPESQTLSGLEEQLISNGLNTKDTALTYRVDLESGSLDNDIRSNNASSLFLNIRPGDNKLFIDFNNDTPWQNYKYTLYKQMDNGQFEFLAETDSSTYVDKGLVNNETYCYYAVSEGSYFTQSDLPDSLFNTSQEACGIPYDLTPPCPPELAVDDDCERLDAELSWTNPNKECAETDDVLDYHIYYAPNRDAEFQMVGTVSGAQNTLYNVSDTLSIAGCYAVTALDSLALRPNGEMQRNESALSNLVCINNCPRYELPNVFTPNNDGKNDKFKPYLNRSVKRVNFKVFSRWGKIIFETEKPGLAWNGESELTGNTVSDGTYFFTCRAYAITLQGIEPIDISGYISVFTSPNSTRAK